MKMPVIERDVVRSLLAKERPLSLPLDKMEPGDSILISEEYWAKFKSRIYGWGVDNKKKLSMRRVENGHRIWRVK